MSCACALACARWLGLCVSLLMFLLVFRLGIGADGGVLLLRVTGGLLTF